MCRLIAQQYGCHLEPGASQVRDPTSAEAPMVSRGLRTQHEVQAPPLFPAPDCASIKTLSRFSHLVLSSPQNQAFVAMCVQPNAVERKVIPDIVLYLLTPPRFRRYSSLTLCPPRPAQGENRTALACAGNISGGEGIRLVNTPCVRVRASRYSISATR